MINHWWFSRPKRKLNSVPEVLSVLANEQLNEIWRGEVEAHLSLEDALEAAGLKRTGDRRDQGGGGARTYKAWLSSLGLVFDQESTGAMQLTLAGEALVRGEAPVPVITHQIMKYQFPSPHSISRGVNVHSRFQIRPFVFLLRLLADSRLNYLTQEEIGKIVITEAENDDSFEHIVSRIIDFRTSGDMVLENDFTKRYIPRSSRPFDALLDVANTAINWLEYTQLIYRDDENSQIISILDEKRNDVMDLLSQQGPLITHPQLQENFQRKYGVDPSRTKDNRNLANSTNVTLRMLMHRSIDTAFLRYASLTPVTTIDSKVVEAIAEQTGFLTENVEGYLCNKYPRGAIGSFMSSYFEMAFQGKEQATEFEVATANLLKDVFDYETIHTGSIGLTPDVVMYSQSANYKGVADNKAYSKYTITNDHRNRMVTNYIAGISSYCKSPLPLRFFSYIAGGFSQTFTGQLRRLEAATSVRGSGVPVAVFIKMIERNSVRKLTHMELLKVFTVGRIVTLSDF